MYNVADIKEMFGFDIRGIDLDLAKGKWVKNSSKWAPNGSVGAIEFFLLPSGKVSRLKTNDVSFRCRDI